MANLGLTQEIYDMSQQLPDPSSRTWKWRKKICFFLLHFKITCSVVMILFHLLFPPKLATSNYSAQFKERDSHALTLGDDFQVQVKIIPFADCCVASIHQSSIIVSYLSCVGLWKQWLSFYLGKSLFNKNHFSNPHL